MSHTDPFETFAAHYDLFPHDEAALKRFFAALKEQYTLRSVLDCSCGTGRDLILLEDLGLETFGSDISRAMLDQARQRVAQSGRDIPLREADCRKLPTCFERRFDAVCCLSTSLPQLLDRSEILAALESMRQVLTPNGVLVLTQGATDKMFHVRPHFVPVVNTRDFSRIMVIDYDEQTWTTHVLDLHHAESDFRFVAHRFQYLTLREEDYRSLLSEVGFGHVRTYGSLSLQAYSKEASDQLIVVAERG